MVKRTAALDIECLMGFLEKVDHIWKNMKIVQILSFAYPRLRLGILTHVLVPSQVYPSVNMGTLHNATRLNYDH
jgi:hypothetical protein